MVNMSCLIHFKAKKVGLVTKTTLALSDRELKAHTKAWSSFSPVKNEHQPVLAVTASERQWTYHGDEGVLLEQLGDFGQLMLEIVDPHIANICAFA